MDFDRKIPTFCTNYKGLYKNLTSGEHPGEGIWNFHLKKVKFPGGCPPSPILGQSIDRCITITLSEQVEEAQKAVQALVDVDSADDSGFGDAAQTDGSAANVFDDTINQLERTPSLHTWWWLSANTVKNVCPNDL